MININSLDSPYMHVYYNIFAIVTSLLELIIFGVILLLDIVFYSKLSESAAFSKVLKNGAFNLYGMLIAVFVIGIIYFGLQLFKFILQVVIHCTSGKKPNPWIILFIQATSLLLLELIRNLILLAVVSCLNNHHQDVIRARSALTIVLMLVHAGMAFFYKMLTTVEKNNDITKILRQVSIIGIFVLCFLIILFNIVMMAILKSGNHPSVQPSEIKLGLFNQTEIDNIEKGVYNRYKDPFYNTRILTDLDKIMYKSYGSIGYRTCRNEPCGLTYYKRFDVSISCTQDKISFFESDCKQAPTVRISFNYALNKKSYPRYYCARISANTGRQRCLPGCDILSNYSIILIQEKNETVEFAWKNFAKCTAQPDFRLKNDSNFLICTSSSTHQHVQLSFIFYCILFIIFYITTIFISI